MVDIYAKISYNWMQFLRKSPCTKTDFFFMQHSDFDMTI